MRAMRFFFSAVLSSLYLSLAVAADLAPDQLLKQVTDEVLEVVVLLVGGGSVVPAAVLHPFTIADGDFEVHDLPAL